MKKWKSTSQECRPGKFSHNISTGVCRKWHWRKADVLRQPVAQGSATQQSFATARCVVKEKIPKSL